MNETREQKIAQSDWHTERKKKKKNIIAYAKYLLEQRTRAIVTLSQHNNKNNKYEWFFTNGYSANKLFYVDKNGRIWMFCCCFFLFIAYDEYF